MGTETYFWIGAGVWLALTVLAAFYPLSEKQALALARARRRRTVKWRLRPRYIRLRASAELKSVLRPDGRFFYAWTKLPDFPAYASALLFGKHHEWLLVGLATENEVGPVWTEKGYDNSGVGISLTREALMEKVHRHNVHSLIMVHNHPGGALAASALDRETTAEWAQEYAAIGLNLVAYVCKAGRFCRFHVSVVDSDTYLPVAEIAERLSSHSPANLLRYLDWLFFAEKNSPGAERSAAGGNCTEGLAKGARPAAETAAVVGSREGLKE